MPSLRELYGFFGESFTGINSQEFDVLSKLKIKFFKLPFWKQMIGLIGSKSESTFCGERGIWVQAEIGILIRGGIDMEITTAMLKETISEMKDARAELEKTVNQVSALRTTIFPELSKYLTEIRSMRMNAVSEMGAILNEMRQVHKFFIESSYEREMKELERFVNLCKEIKQLKQDGVFDAVCDSAIRLAIQEQKQ